MGDDDDDRDAAACDGVSLRRHRERPSRLLAVPHGLIALDNARRRFWLHRPFGAHHHHQDCLCRRHGRLAIRHGGVQWAEFRCVLRRLRLRRMCTLQRAHSVWALPRSCHPWPPAVSCKMKIPNLCAIGPPNAAALFVRAASEKDPKQRSRRAPLVCCHRIAWNTARYHIGWSSC